jgi:long-chain acyl-CoA synthetase
VNGSGRRLGQALSAWDECPAESPAPRRAAEVLSAGEAHLASTPGPSAAPEERDLWRRFLEATGRSPFLRALETAESRSRWAEVAFQAIRRSGTTLETLLEDRARVAGDRTLFEEYGRASAARWSYARVRTRVRTLAAAFLAEAGPEPRVALYLDNGVDGACCDLACLLHDLFVTPLSTHFNADELAWIFDRLGITLAVADSEERLRRLMEVRRRARIPFTLFAVQPNRFVERGEARLLGEAAARVTPESADAALAARRRRGLDESCTVMFTSGSTGRPKGVVFTPFQLVSKRFARAAALPEVGEAEVLLCFLPLYHTFGRFLEMLGMIYWRGTYVFAGNPSVETLLSGMREVRPTGLISIPLRWVQIRDRSLEAMQGARSPGGKEEAFRALVGDRLRWGLSAAGYLEPKVFQHFNRLGVRLCSGFGMTEATGGITMSPPGDYVAGSVGVPLPGIKVRLSESGEMRIAGSYVARYLPDEGHSLEGSPGIREEGEEWIATGDVFRRLDGGHLSIVDRVKDIYKNDRGQTVAPNRVERKFQGVPGFKRSFLVGDHRSYNVLLIVPEPGDPVIQEALHGESRREYFRQIIAAANEDLAPYERVVNFALLERDFDAQRGELTAKGSYRRKAIEEHFAAAIESLYQRPWVELSVASVPVRVPRWFYRDLGILEEDLHAEGGELRDRRRGLALPLRREKEEPLVRVGDLDYAVDGGIVDLGVFARQPRIWLGNPSLIRFAPCKEGWDVSPGGVAPEVLLPRDFPAAAGDLPARPRGIGDALLLEVNAALQTALFSGPERSVAALERLSRDLVQSDDRLAAAIRRRLAALSRHPDEIVRCLAYRILLLDEPAPGYSDAFSAFIDSGLSFLNQESIAAIASARFEQRRLHLLRQRLFRYRSQMSWPCREVPRQQLQNVLSLLAEFARHHPEYYKPVRAELTSWVLHREDPRLSAFAQELLSALSRWLEERLEKEAPVRDRARPAGSIQFDEEIPLPERERLSHLLLETSFLRESVQLTFDEQEFEPGEIGEAGIWISRMQSRGRYQLYRASVNTRRFRHFDLLVILRDDMDAAAVMHTNYWMVAIGEHPCGDRSLPRFGCVRPDLAAMSLEFVRELTVADRIRELAGVDRSGGLLSGPNAWRKLFVRALSAILRAWSHGARRILPGSIEPANVVVPELDYQEDAVLLSLAGWEPYRNTLSLFRPIVRTFYDKTRVLYPGSARVLSVDWIFEACVEALGDGAGLELLRRLRREAAASQEAAFADSFLESLDAFLSSFPRSYHRPLPLSNAIERYGEWSRINPSATTEARAQLLEQLLDLYHLGRFGEMARYQLYRHTFFAPSSTPVLEAFDRLLEAMQTDPARSAAERVELSDLQATLAEPGELDVFSRLVFPQARASQRLEVVAFGDASRRQATVRTHFTDERGETFDMREPVEPEEIGQLYRLFFQEHFPKTVSEMDRYLIAADAGDRVVGGICYRLENPEVAHLDGVVVNSPVAGRGIATALLEDFATRMASRGVKVLRTGFIMREFCEQRGFRVDRRWGGLVRLLMDEAQAREHPEEARVS